MIGVNHVAFSDEHSALDAILQFADIARPVVAHEHVDHGTGEPTDVLVVRLEYTSRK